MKKIVSLIGILFLNFFNLYSQTYTSYRIGSLQDTVVQPKGGLCMMGGAQENDQAAKWFLQQANHGDILVLRTSGADGYNLYFYQDLGIYVHSVETIVFHDSLASFEPYIHQRIQEAEAIWFAGGNQWNYIRYWRNTPIDSLIRWVIKNKKTVIGGTSAGMAILGKFYFTAQYGTITSSQALSNPYDYRITVDSTSFIHHPLLSNYITDTHFDNPDRKGRLTTFLARIYTDFNVSAKAIACDEYTAVCIDTNEIAKVYGHYPNYDDYAYFVQINCEIANPTPEICIPNQLLTWNHQAKAIKVKKLYGDTLGTNFINIQDWNIGYSGDWFNWYVTNGSFTETYSQAPYCSTTSLSSSTTSILQPNYYYHSIYRQIIITDTSATPNIQIFNILGQKMRISIETNDKTYSIPVHHLSKGIYILLINERSHKILIE